jgi:hypothetical protein
MNQLSIFGNESRLRELQEKHCKLEALFWETRDPEIRRKALLSCFELTEELLKLGRKVDKGILEVYYDYKHNGRL